MTSVERTAGLMRVRGMLRKEFLQAVRDPSSVAIAFVLPVVLLVLFGYGTSLDLQHAPLGFVIDQPGAESSALLGAFRESPYFAVRRYASIAGASAALREQEVQGIVWLRGDFGRDRAGGRKARAALFVNGVNANNARLIMGYVEGAWATWAASAAGRTALPAVRMEERVWFNPDMRSRNFLVPGLIALIMTLIGALLTSLVVAREWERGTIEALLATPITRGELLIAKTVPYFVLGMGGMLLTVAIGVWLMDVPLRGSLPVLIATSALFLLGALGMGLLISTVTRNQFVAAQAAILTTYLPALILSGLIFNIAGMPAPIRWLTHLIAARYFVAIAQTLFLAGDVWGVIAPNSIALIVIAALFLTLVVQKTSKRLE